MDLKELQALIQKATDNYAAQKAENEHLQAKFNALESKHTALMSDFDKIKDSGSAADTKALTAKIEEL